MSILVFLAHFSSLCPMIPFYWKDMYRYLEIFYWIIKFCHRTFIFPKFLKNKFFFTTLFHFMDSMSLCLCWSLWVCCFSWICFPESPFFGCPGLELISGEHHVRLTNVVTDVLAPLGSGASGPLASGRFFFHTKPWASGSRSTLQEVPASCRGWIMERGGN